MEQQLDITADDVIRQLRAIAMADVTGAVGVTDGQLEIRATRELPDDLRSAICSVEKSSVGVKIKFYDKLRALELLGKMLGLFDRQPEREDGENDLLQAVLRSTKEEMDTHDIPEIQQAAAAGNDLVEQEGLS
jgi:phage terminase small subunit